MSAARPTTDRRRDALSALNGFRTLVAIAAVTAAALVMPSAVRWVLLPFVLFLPGHALVLAIWGGRDVGEDLVIRVAVRLMLSFAALPLIGMAVSITGPLTRTSAILATAGVCIVATFIGILRGASLDLGSEAPPVTATSESGDAEAPSRVALQYALAIGLGIAVLLGVHSLMPDAVQEPFSALALRSDGVEAAAGAASISVEVRNDTARGRDYAIAVDPGDGQPWAPVDLRLGPGEVRTLTLEGPYSAVACAGTAQVVLQTSGRPTETLSVPPSGEC